MMPEGLYAAVMGRYDNVLMPESLRGTHGFGQLSLFEAVGSKLQQPVFS